MGKNYKMEIVALAVPSVTTEAGEGILMAGSASFYPHFYEHFSYFLL